MRFLFGFILGIIALGVQATESDSLYASAMKMMRHERETEARELLERCLESENTVGNRSALDSLNVEHWLYYLKNRNLTYDGEYKPDFNFTPVSRDILRPYFPALDSAYTVLGKGAPAQAAALLENAYARACADPLIPLAYRLDMLLRLDNIESSNKLSRTALPRLEEYARHATGADELGFEVAGALYGGYGSDIFKHLSPGTFTDIGFSTIISSLMAGRAAEAIDRYGAFISITNSILGPNSIESLQLMSVERMIISLAVQPDRRQEFLADYLARMEAAAGQCMARYADKETAVDILQILLSLNSLRPKTEQDDSTVADFIRRHDLADDDRACLLLSGYYEESDPAMSRRYAEKAFDIVSRSKIGGERHTNAAMRLYFAALDADDFDAALDYRLRSEANATKAVADSLEGRFYIEAALSLSRKNDYAGQAAMLRRALAHEENTRGSQTEHSARLLASLTRALIQASLYSEARSELYRLTALCDTLGLSIYDFIDKFETEDEIHRGLALPYDGFARLVADMPAIESSYGKYSSRYRTALKNLADEYIGAKDYAAGIACFEKFMAVDSIARGAFHDPVPANVTLRFYRHLAEPSDSSARRNLEYLEALLPLYDNEESSATIHGQTVLDNILQNIEYYTLYLGEYRKLSETSARRKEGLPENSTGYLACLNNILWSAGKLHDNDLAYSTLPQYIAAARALCTPRLILMTDEERSAFWPRAAKELNLRVLAPLFDGGGDRFAPFAYDNALLNKGLLLQSSRTIDKALENEPALKAELSRVVELQKTEENPENKKQLYIREKEILALISDRTDWGDFLSLRWQDVADNLPDTAIAVEFCTIGSGDDARYGALVLMPDDEPRFIDLFRLKNLRRSDDSYRFITDSIWAPIDALCPDAGTIYFSPVGELCRLPLEAAPAPQQPDLAMADVRTLYRLSSTRRLVRRQEPAAITTGVAIGGLHYDMDSKTLADDSRRHRKADLPLRSARGYFSASTALTYLPGTEREAREVARMAKKARLKFNVYTGTKGTEAFFKTLSGSDTGIMHIATHGFYWTEEEAEYMPRLDRLFADLRTTEDRSMSRSGLMLAGADRAYRGMDIDDDCEDGILTAREIADLDLSATDFVVLSACNTALGDISGEGVFGLQRGFKKAGVNSLLLSLWKVSDEATTLLMNHFYNALFAGQTKTEALDTARRRLRSYTAADGTCPYSEPEFWAPFILLDAER